MKKEREENNKEKQDCRQAADLFLYLCTRHKKAKSDLTLVKTGATALLV